MTRYAKNVSKKIGLSPGSLVYTGNKKTEKTKITLIDYDENNFEEKELKTIEESFPFKKKPTITWINIDGLHEVDIIEKIGKNFNIHSLLLEDILHPEQRPKIDESDDYIFIVLKMLSFDKKKNKINSEQISLIMGSNYVISFQEKEGDIFEGVRERIRQAKGRIRKMGSDYLAYVLLDVIIDNYFTILEHIGERIEDYEEALMTNTQNDILKDIYSLKRETLFLRKSVWPLREVISNLDRCESDLINDKTSIFIKDLYEHTIQVIDTVETFRDMISGLLDLYLSSVSNRMNEVMKVLTIMSTVFIPLTFIAGIYGMNFDYMPELNWHYGYFGIWGIMAVIALGMFMFFRKKKWM